MHKLTKKLQSTSITWDGNSQWDGNIEGLLVVGYGVSGMVLILDEFRVVKVGLGMDARSIQDLETERRAYRNLERVPSTHVLWCYETENPHGLVLERCPETVRHHIRSRRRIYSAQNEALRLATEAAKGLAVVHACGIIHGDVGCHNMLLDSNESLKIADFAGSSVDGLGASVDYEVGSRLPGESEPTVKTDLFALGSAMYEMATGEPPYRGKSYAEIQTLYKRRRFPKSDALPDLQAIIKNCWWQVYDSAEQVLAGLDEIPSRQRSPNNRHGSSNKRPLRVVQPPKTPSPPRDFNSDGSSKQPEKAPLDRGVLETYVNSSPNRPRYRRHKTSTKRHVERRYHGKMDWKSPVSEWFHDHSFWPTLSGTSRKKQSYYY